MKNNPFIGPRAFKYGEALHGRESEVEQLIDLLIAERIVLLYSPSGAGKTSMIQAALMPQLEHEEFYVFPVIRVNAALPRNLSEDTGANLFVVSVILSLEESLAREQRMPIEQIVQLSLGDYLRQREERGDVQGNEVLIFDQFEEVLTVDPKAHVAKLEFFEEVGTVLHDRNRWALFSMREELEPRLDPYLAAVPTRLKTRFRLDLLRKDAAQRAIQIPAENAGVSFTDAAARKLVDDLRRTSVQRQDGTAEKTFGEYIEPVQLQVVCRRLWEGLEESHTKLEQEDIETIEDVDAALAGYYSVQVSRVAADTGAGERNIRDWFENCLITEYGIRGQVLKEPEQSGGLENNAIWGLVDYHLVRAENRLDATWFELAHDRLIDPVRNNNAEWREAHLSLLQMEAEMWEKQGRPDSLLLSGSTLTDAEQWAAAHAKELTFTEESLLALSRKAQVVVEREVRRNRIIHGLAYTLAVLSVGMAYIAYSLWLDARPWGVLTNISTGRVHELAGEAVSVGRSTERLKNDVDLVYRMVSRVHLRIQKDRTAIDMRSLLGTTVNGIYLPYGESVLLEDGDIVTISGIGGFKFQSIPYLHFQIWPASLERVTPVDGWGVLIDGKNRKIHPLNADENFVVLGTNGEILVSDSIHNGSKPLVVIRRHNGKMWYFEDQHGEGEELSKVTVKDEVDDVPLLIEVKTGNTYTYRVCIVPSGKEYWKFSWNKLVCKISRGRDDFMEDQLEDHDVFSATYHLLGQGIYFRIVPNLVGLER